MIPFFRVAACSPAVCPADVDFNVNSILTLLRRLENHKVDLAVFPELCITGYTCGDLFFSSTLLLNTENALTKLCNETRNYKIAFIVGAPLHKNGTLYNCSFFIHGGKIIAINGKRYLPNYDEFYERRWFESWVEKPHVVELKGVKIGTEICEDLWIPKSPSEELCLAGCEVIANLSASDDTIGKYSYLVNLLTAQSGKSVSAYVYASAGYGESTTDLVFDGKTMIFENGKMLVASKRWEKNPHFVINDVDIEALRHDRMKTGYFIPNDDITVSTINHQVHSRDVSDIDRIIAKFPFVPECQTTRNARCEEIINIQSLALQRRIEFTRCCNIVIGISGGLDSTLALLVAYKTFISLGLDVKGIHGITMPGFGTTIRTESNAEKLCRQLGISFESIPIADAVLQHFKDIGHDQKVHDITYENAQARTRTLILMDLANKYRGMVLGTGDMSELALGWATYNGDHMSMYNVNGGVPKTLVRYLVEWFADEDPHFINVSHILKDIIATPISPELLPPDQNGTISQKTEELVGPYELHDFFLYHMLRYGAGPTKIFAMANNVFGANYDAYDLLKWLKQFYQRFFTQQFKRSCMPDGPKIGSVALSPRGDWRMPSDASANIWIDEVDKLIKTYC